MFRCGFVLPQQNDIHITFEGQVTAVDDFYSIHKPAIFSVEQLILHRSFAVRRISERKIITVSDTLEFDLNFAGIKLNIGSFFLRYLDLCMIGEHRC